MATMSHGETGKPAKRDYWFEMIAVILLGIATIGSAWCGYQASTWNGEESRQARNATDYRVEASRLFALGTQKVSYDANIGAQYADAYVSKKPGCKKFIRAPGAQGVPAGPRPVGRQGRRGRDLVRQPVRQQGVHGRAVRRYQRPRPGERRHAP